MLHQTLTAFLEASRSKKSYVQYRQMYETQFLRWPDRLPTFLEIECWHQTLLPRPHYGNKALSLLKAALTWGLRHELFVGQNPATGVKRHPTISRDRVLAEQEVAIILSTLELIPGKLAALLCVLLLTGCRLSEALKMKRVDLDLVSGFWRQPHTKNGRPHNTYVPTQARARLTGLGGSGEYYFEGVYAHHYARCSAEKVWLQVRASLGFQDVRLHDFRRTLATHLYRATHDDMLVKRCLNHVNPSVTAIYIRIPLDDVRSALQRQADAFYALRHHPSLVAEVI